MGRSSPHQVSKAKKAPRERHSESSVYTHKPTARQQATEEEPSRRAASAVAPMSTRHSYQDNYPSQPEWGKGEESAEG